MFSFHDLRAQYGYEYHERQRDDQTRYIHYFAKSREFKRKKKYEETFGQGLAESDVQNLVMNNYFLLVSLLIGRPSTTWSSCWNKKTVRSCDSSH